MVGDASRLPQKEFPWQGVAPKATLAGYRMLYNCIDWVAPGYGHGYGVFAPQAIEDAVEDGVDIMVLSWTLNDMRSVLWGYQMEPAKEFVSATVQAATALGVWVVTGAGDWGWDGLYAIMNTVPSMDVMSVAMVDNLGVSCHIAL